MAKVLQHTGVTDEVPSWSLFIRAGKVYVIRGQPWAIVHQEVSKEYLDKLWFKNIHGAWQVLGSPTMRFNFLKAIHYLAMAVLPWWENHIHPGA